MSHAQLEHFYDKINADLALKTSVTAGVTTHTEFVDRLVAAAKADGLDVAPADVDGWVRSQTTPEAPGELSDEQLETISGGAPPRATWGGRFSLPVFTGL